MAKIPVINNVLHDYKKKKFWDENDSLIDTLLDELASSRSWRTDVELYEYMSYVLDNTALELRDFDEAVNPVIWSSLLSVNFGKMSHILDDDNSPEYLILTNYYPYTDPLKDCKNTLNKLNTLVIINKETNGYNHDAISAEGRKLYEELYSNFDRMNETNDYMKYVDNIEIFKNFISHGLNNIISMENVSSSQVSLSDSDGANQIIAQVKEAQANVPYVASENTSSEETITNEVEDTLATEVTDTIEDDSQITDPNFIAQVAQDTPVEINNSSINLSTRDDGESSIVKDVIQVPTSGTNEEAIQEISAPAVDDRPPMDKIDGNRIDTLLYKDFDLNVFIDAFNELESRCHIAERQKNMDDIKYFLSVAKDLFSEFDVNHTKIEKNKPKHGQPDFRDLEGWQRTGEHVKRFKDKWFVTYKEFVNN